MEHPTHEEIELSGELPGRMWSFVGHGGGFMRGENPRETMRTRDLRFQPPEEPLGQSYYGLQMEHAKYRDEASRLREEHDDLGTRNMGLHKKDGALTRRILELIDDAKPVAAEHAEKAGRLLNATIEGVQKENKSLKMAITGLQKENGSLNTAIEGFQEEKRLLDEGVRKLKGQNENVRRCNEELRSCATRLEQALREVQEREYAAVKHQDIESHEVVSAQFENLFRQCGDWARRYFKLGIGDFRIEEFPLFARELELVSWSDVNWRDKKHFKVNHLVQAVLGNILVRKVFKCPFAGCARDFRREFGDLYEIKLREGESAAHRWRASSLTTYHQCENWPPIGGPRIETYRIGNLKEIGDLLWEVLSPITATYFRDRTAGESRSQGYQLFAIIGEALALAAKVSQKASKLVTMDKEWFQNNGRQFSRSDDRMKDRLGDGDDSPGADLTVDLILTPGFLKHLSDDTEHVNQYTVWMPAKVDIRDPLGGDPPPTSGETQANKRAEVWDAQDFTPGPQADLLEDQSGNEELPGEEAYESDEIV